jgi:hypothetical protein
VSTHSYTCILFNITVFPGFAISVLPISSCSHRSVRPSGILISYSKIKRVSTSLISFVAKKRPGHAWRLYPNARFVSLVVTNWLRAWSVALPPSRSFEERKPSKVEAEGYKLESA